MDFQHMIPCLKETAHAILGVDSPTGFTARAVETAEQMARAMGYRPAGARRETSPSWWRAGTRPVPSGSAPMWTPWA